LRARAQIVNNFGEILSRAHGNFEQQNWALESCIVIINCYNMYLYIIVIVYIITRRERTRCSKAFLGSLFRQPVTSNRFLFIKRSYSLASSFGSNDNHAQHLFLHVYTVHNMARSVLNWGSNDCRVPRKSSRVPLCARVP
jgi:hypothetical protein